MSFLYPHGNTEFEFQRMKVFQDSGLKSVLTTLLSKIMWGYVTLFQIEKYQLVYWINVRE